MLTPGHIILSIPISFDWIVVCAAVQTSTQPPYITHQGCASHQHWLLFNSIFNHLILLQHHTLADRCYSTVLQYLQQLLSLSWVIIKADHYFLSDYTALIHCSDAYWLLPIPLSLGSGAEMLVGHDWPNLVPLGLEREWKYIGLLLEDQLAHWVFWKW